jgi:hypothetical protein
LFSKHVVKRSYVSNRDWLACLLLSARRRLYESAVHQIIGAVWLAGAAKDRHAAAPVVDNPAFKRRLRRGCNKLLFARAATCKRLGTAERRDAKRRKLNARTSLKSIRQEVDGPVNRPKEISLPAGLRHGLCRRLGLNNWHGFGM